MLLLLTSSWLLSSTPLPTPSVRWLPTFPSLVPSLSLLLVSYLPVLLLPLVGCTGSLGPLLLLLSCQLLARSSSSGPAPSLLPPGLAFSSVSSPPSTFSPSAFTVRSSSGLPPSRLLPSWAGSSTPCAWSAVLARLVLLVSATGATRALGALVF